MIDEASVGQRSAAQGSGDDLRPENCQYLKCAKEHADETFSLTQLDPAEHTCLVYLSVLLYALAKKHDRKLRSTRKPTCAHRRKSILVANESCIFPFGAAALGMLGYGQLSNKKPCFRQVLHPRFCAPVEFHGHVHVAVDGPRHGRHLFWRHSAIPIVVVVHLNVFLCCVFRTLCYCTKTFLWLESKLTCYSLIPLLQAASHP